MRRDDLLGGGERTEEPAEGQLLNLPGVFERSGAQLADLDDALALEVAVAGVELLGDEDEDGARRCDARGAP